MKCPGCGRRVRFNNRSNTCDRCGAWLLSRPPSQHELEHMRKGPGKDDWLNDFPWIGGMPGRRAMGFTIMWIFILVVLAIGILVSFVTMHFVLAIVLIFVTAIVGTFPQFFLIGSRI